MINSTPVLAYDRRRNRLDPGTTSLERRLQDLNGYAEQNGLRIVQLIIDEDIAAWQRSVRQDHGWRLLMRALRAGEYKGQTIRGLLVSHLERITRDDRDVLELLGTLDQHDLPLYTFQGGPFHADGRGMLRQMTEQAIRTEQAFRRQR